MITLKGRAKDMYIQGGFNVYPAEVEAYLATHPDVLMVAGIGVADPVLGEIGRYVVARPGAQLTRPRFVAGARKVWPTGAEADRLSRRAAAHHTGKIHKAALRA